MSVNCTPFLENIARVNIAGIELILNFDNGSIVGLTESGANIVDRLAKGEIDLSQARAAEPVLLKYLEDAKFFSKSDTANLPISIYYHVTQRCNLTCVGCYSEDRFRNRIVDVPCDVVCGGLKKLKGLPIESVTFSGGEPFLRQDLAEILCYAKNYCRFRTIRVITNGLALDEETIYRVSPYVDEIAVSFDGFSSSARAWIRGEQNYLKLSLLVQAIKRSGIQPHVISTIHSRNIDDIDMCRQFADDLNVPYHFSLFSYYESQPTASELTFNDSSLTDLCNRIYRVKNKEGKTPIDIVSAARAKKRCGCGSTNLSIGYDGNIYPCHMLHSEKYLIGNLYTDFEEEEDIKSAIQNLEICRINVDEIEQCRECEFRYICGGGCRARSLFAFGDVDKKDPYCALMKQYYEKAFGELFS